MRAGESSDESERGRPARRWRKRLAALAIGYLLVEIVVMPVFAAKAPLRLRARLPTPMYILGEPSKAGFLPRDYVLVLGDSYAEGYGDWLTAALNEDGNPPFQAIDILHQRTSRDLVTFGRGGASSLSAIVFLVEKRFAALRRVGLGDPSDVWIYFYEGNDLIDNLNEARRYVDLGDRPVTSLDDDELDALVARRARSGWWKGLPGTLFVPYLVLNACKGASAGLELAPIVIPIRPVADAKIPPEHNVIDVGGQLHYFDGRAESPSLELSDAEVAFGIDVLARSLLWAKERFRDARMTLVYLPSPLACYAIASPQVSVKVTEPGRETLYPARAVRARSDDLRRRVGALAAALEVRFVDTTPALQAAGARELVHGPRDAFHFNRAGYTVLADVLEDEL